MKYFDILLEFSKICAKRPFFVLSEHARRDYCDKLKNITENIIKQLENKNMQDTYAYRIIYSMQTAVVDDPFNELKFASALEHLDELYVGNHDDVTEETIKKLNNFAVSFRKRAMEFYSHEAIIEKASKNMSKEEIINHDKKILQEVGSFYVWEYTLILEQELFNLDEKKQRELLEKGLTVKAGNLPGLFSLMNTLRNELAFNLYDRELRNRVLKTFFDFHDIIYRDKISDIIIGLKKFNLEIIRIAIAGGLEVFTGVIYKPYSDNTPLMEIADNLSK